MDQLWDSGENLLYHVVQVEALEEQLLAQDLELRQVRPSLFQECDGLPTE